jgi:probable F420-dependent oxidoreductase
MPKKFRFGVVCGELQDGEQWGQYAHRVESLGYDRLLAPDTFSPDRPAAFPALATAAQETRLRVGSYVCCTDYRHPVILAKEAATLNRLTGGRFELGLGPGNWIDDYQQAGISFEPAGTRVSKFAESLHIIKALLGKSGEETVSYQGTYFTITHMKGFSLPQQSPPAIFVGAGGKRMLSIAGREADIVGIAPITAKPNAGYGPTAFGIQLANATDEPTLQKIAWVREAARDRFDSLELASPLFAVIPTNESEQVARRIAQNAQVSPEEVRSALSFAIGTHEQIAETLWKRRERYGISYIIVLDKDRETFAPIITLLKDWDQSNT